MSSYIIKIGAARKMVSMKVIKHWTYPLNMSRDCSVTRSNLHRNGEQFKGCRGGGGIGRGTSGCSCCVADVAFELLTKGRHGYWVNWTCCTLQRLRNRKVIAIFCYFSSSPKIFFDV